VRAETREQVRAALIRLPERDREVLVMYHLEQLTAGEIAEVLGLTEEAVRSRQRRALRRITRLLNPLR
jgi:RNA polymerase sigma factor (sigma-70 family)